LLGAIFCAIGPNCGGVDVLEKQKLLGVCAESAIAGLRCASGPAISHKTPHTMAKPEIFFVKRQKLRMKALCIHREPPQEAGDFLIAILLIPIAFFVNRIFRFSSNRSVLLEN
jgi:hypothetical protein